MAEAPSGVPAAMHSDGDRRRARIGVEFLISAAILLLVPCVVSLIRAPDWAPPFTRDWLSASFAHGWLQLLVLTPIALIWFIALSKGSRFHHTAARSTTIGVLLAACAFTWIGYETEESLAWFSFGYWLLIALGFGLGALTLIGASLAPRLRPRT